MPAQHLLRAGLALALVLCVAARLAEREQVEAVAGARSPAAGAHGS